MKRSIALSIALALSVVLVSLMSFDSTAQAQPQVRFRADTGIVNPGPNQVLRITLGTSGGNYNPTVRFRRIEYGQGTCNGDGVCKHAVASQTTSDPITLMPGEAASFDIPASFLGGVYVGVRGVVLSNSRDVRVNVMIINDITGEVDAFYDISPEFRNCQFPLCGG